MPRPSPLPHGLAGEPFTTDTARQAGVSRARTRASDLSAPFRGVRMPASAPLTIRTLCAAYATRMPGDQHFSHATAALLHGLPLPTPIERDLTLHVTVVAPGTPPRADGVVGHQTEAGHARVVIRGGLRVADPTDAWCQLATGLGLDDLVAVGDSLVRRKGPLATLAELDAAVHRFRRRRGAKRLRAARARVRAGTDSPKETIIRMMIERGGLPEPVVNRAIANRHGAFVALGDMVYEAYKVLVEYDGAHHFAGETQAFKDIERLDELMEERWRVIRLNRTHLRREATVVGKVRTALLDAGWRP